MRSAPANLSHSQPQMQRQRLLTPPQPVPAATGEAGAPPAVLVHRRESVEGLVHRIGEARVAEKRKTWHWHWHDPCALVDEIIADLAPALLRDPKPPAAETTHPHHRYAGSSPAAQQ